MAAKTPVKLFYKIGEVAQLLQVEAHTLRYWEQQFSAVRPRKSSNGHRVYRRVDVERLEAIRDLLYREGFTIAGVKKRIKTHGIDALRGDALAPKGAVSPSVSPLSGSEATSARAESAAPSQLTSLFEPAAQSELAARSEPSAAGGATAEGATGGAARTADHQTREALRELQAEVKELKDETQSKKRELGDLVAGLKRLRSELEREYVDSFDEEPDSPDESSD